MMRWMGVLIVALLTSIAGGTMAEPQIQQLTSPKGTTYWLVESPQIPMVSVEVALRAGSAFEPVSKQGLASMTASMMDEGAGDLDAKAFKEALDELGARFGAGSDKLDVTVHLTTLIEHAEAATQLAALALHKPRFDSDALERMKAATIAGIQQSEENPGAVAGRAFAKAVFDDHAYARQSVGTVESVAGLTVEDVKAWHTTQLTKANMVVSVVGAVKPNQAGKLVDVLVEDLPAGTARNVITEGPKPTTPQLVRIEKTLPQATIMLGHVGMSRDDPDYYPMLVMNEMLGGGILTSRLFEVVREKHGLVYGVGSANTVLPKGGMFVVQLQTENGKAQKALDLIKAELERIRTTQPTDQEFADVVDYLVGSFPLRVDSNGKVLDYLSLMQMENLGADYLTKWVGHIKAVTPADIQRVAAKLIQPDAMAVTIVGSGPAMKAHW